MFLTYQLTRVVPDKGPLNGCLCFCVSGDIKCASGFSALTLFVEQQEGLPVCEKLGVVGCWSGCLSGGETCMWPS